MDDSMLEREIEDLLAVDPASDFRARVRQRIAQEPPLDARQPLWQPLWMFAATGAVAAIAVVIVMVLRVDPAPKTTRDLEAHAIDQLVHVSVAPSVVAPDIARTIRSTPRTRTPAAPQMSMIVHAPEAAAWRRLLTAIHSGAIDLSPLARVTGESPSLPESEDFVLPRIVIEPLAPAVPEQGVRP
jgi:hypothetical protein